MSDEADRLKEILDRLAAKGGVMLRDRLAEFRGDIGWLLVENDRLQAIVDKQAKQLEAANAVVDKLPKTADGVLIEYGDTVWVRNQEIGEYEDDLCFYNPGWTNDDGDFQWVHVEDCYSTPEAAEQAKEEK